MQATLVCLTLAALGKIAACRESPEILFRLAIQVRRQR